MCVVYVCVGYKCKRRNEVECQCLLQLFFHTNFSSASLIESVTNQLAPLLSQVDVMIHL